MNLKIILIAAIYILCHFTQINCQESSIFELNSENFEDSLQKYPFLYVKFFSEKCPFSKKIAETWIMTGSALKSSQIKVAELECIKNKETCEQQNVFSYPVIKMFKNGHEVGTFDTDKFNVNLENFVEFAKSFSEVPAKELTENRRAFGKCLGR